MTYYNFVHYAIFGWYLFLIIVLGIIPFCLFLNWLTKKYKEMEEKDGMV